MANPILRNPIIAAVIGDLNAGVVDADAVQRHLDIVRAQIAENNAICADAAAQLPQASGRFAEAMFAHAAHHEPPESEELQKTQQPPTLPEPDDEEELDELVAALAAEFVEIAARIVQVLQEEGEAAVRLDLEVEDPEVSARAADCVDIAVHLELHRQMDRFLIQAHGFLLVVRAAAIAVTRAHLLPGVLLTVAAAYALAYAASGGAVVPGPASLLRISVLVLCFLFRVPVVGNFA